MRWLFVLAVLLPGCLFEPDVRLKSCEIRCEQKCSAGFTCRDGFCVSPSFRGECASPISVLVDDEVKHFACQPLEIELQTSGEVGAVHWSHSELPDRLTLDETGKTGKLVAEAGELEEGYYNVELFLRDERGTIAEHALAIDVEGCPRVKQPKLEPLCPGSETTLNLVADGGYENYSWSIVDAEDSPAWIELSGSTLTARPPEAAIGEHHLTVRVDDFDEDDSESDAGTTMSSLFSHERTLTFEVADCLRVNLPRKDEICTQDEYAFVLDAAGGEAPYRWNVDHLPPGLELVEGDDETRLEGTPEAAGTRTITLSVEDANDDSVPYELELAILACPMMAVDPIVACEGEYVTRTLEAASATGDVTWRKVSGPRWLDLVDDAVLGGQATLEPDADPLVLSVSDQAGMREDTVSVNVYEWGSGTCVQPLEVNAEPVDACAGQLYTFQLAGDGPGAHTWRKDVSEAHPWPAWLNLSANGVLSGQVPLDASGRLELNVQIESAQANTLVVPLTLTVREHCKYAFIGTDEAVRTHLYLGDSRQAALPGAPSPVDLTAELPDAYAVDSFTFSPDGTRISAIARPFDSELPDQLIASTIAGVSLVQGLHIDVDDEPAWKTIDQAAWSNDSRRLALLVSTAVGARRLLLFDLIDSTLVLTDSDAVPATNPKHLFWLVDRPCYIGVLGETDSSEIPVAGPFCQLIGEDGELAGAELVQGVGGQLYEDADRVQYLASGGHLFQFLSLDDAPYLTLYVFRDGAVATDKIHQNAIPDPTLSWLAQPGDDGQRAEDEPEVGIFPIDPSVDTLGVPFDSAVSNCHAVRAWELRGRALACETDESLRVALLDEQGGIALQGTVQDSNSFLRVNSRRTFDSSVQWFAYGSADRELVVVDLGTPTWQAVPVMGYQSSLMNLTATSNPGELLLHSGAELFRVSLETGMSELLDDSLQPALPCGADFGNVGPDEWCGGNLAPSSYVIDPSGMSVVYPDDETGTLRVIDLKAPVGTPEVVSEASVTCDQRGCSPLIRFAP